MKKVLVKTAENVKESFYSAATDADLLYTGQSEQNDFAELAKSKFPVRVIDGKVFLTEQTKSFNPAISAGDRNGKTSLHKMFELMIREQPRTLRQVVFAVENAGHAFNPAYDINKKIAQIKKHLRNRFSINGRNLFTIDDSGIVTIPANIIHK